MYHFLILFTVLISHTVVYALLMACQEGKHKGKMSIKEVPVLDEFPDTVGEAT